MIKGIGGIRQYGNTKYIKIPPEVYTDSQWTFKLRQMVSVEIVDKETIIIRKLKH